MAADSLFDRAPLRVFLLACAALLALRIAGLVVSPLELHFDEAQYWAWSRSLDWGYFSKPPLVAWAIWSTTSLFGNAEWAVRLAAPIAHAFGALALFALAQRLYGARAAVWAGVLWLTMPAVWVSSAVISTDALMLPLWCLGLFALWRLVETKHVGWAVALGAAIGCGTLAKYAMLYFLLCAGIAALVCKPVREALLHWRGVLAVLIAAAIVAPNFIWNAGHEFQTVAHTASNANLDGPLVHPEEALEFLLSQFGVLGPVLFAAFLILLGLNAGKLRALSQEDRFLLAFALPPLIIILGQALISRANANWAAAAYPAALLWVIGRLNASRPGRWALIGALVTQLLIGALVFAVGVSPALGDRAGLSGAIKRNRGWAETVQRIEAEAEAIGAEKIVVDHRALYNELAYYGRDRDLPPVRMWVLTGDAKSQAEAESPLENGDASRLLVVHYVPRYRPLVADDFARFAAIGEARIPVGGGQTRDLQFSQAQEFEPAPRDQAFAERLNALRIGPAKPELE